MEKDNILDSMRKMLIDYIKQNIAQSKNEWCNKDNWWIVVKHSFRVENYAVQIMKEYKELSEIEKLTLQIATILHDIGKVVQSQDHAKISAEIVKDIFDKNSLYKDSDIDLIRVTNIISKHSDKKDENDKDILSIILKDSDIIDEIGAMSVLAQGSKYQFYTYGFYEKIVDVINEKEIPFCEKNYLLLKTNIAKRIMREKIEFIKKFRNQLEYEITGQVDNINLVLDNS